MLFSTEREGFMTSMNLDGMSRKFHVGILYFEVGKTCRIWGIFLRRVIYRDWGDFGGEELIGIGEILEGRYLFFMKY